jgi:CRISPR-associated endonuclease/helicase Cas3
MPKTDGETKQRRIELVYRLLERYPNGLTEQEIADVLNFGRRAVNNYLRELETKGQVYKDGRKWLVLPYHAARLRRIDLSPEEAMTLYLATRLLVKQHDKRNESAETALGKLAEALTGDLNVGDEIHQAALELAQRPGDVGYSRVFRTMMQGYLYRRKVAVTYRPLKGEPFETLFCPYLLEPSAIGYATYAIGHSSVVDALRTYKLQRIQTADLTHEEYRVPPDFPGLDYLRSAWSIIAGEELISVKLRFSPGVTERVRESRWHPSQEIDDDPDHPGGCIWRAKIADLTDFVPWVRGWGSDVEVLGPEALREALVRETRKLARLYHVGNLEPIPLYQRLWGKADRETGEIHALIYHMLDVAAVAQVLWDESLTDGVRTQIAAALRLDITAAGRLLAFWAGTHDLGKASPCFQSRNVTACRQLVEAANAQSISLKIPEKALKEDCYHGTLTTATLATLLEQETGLDSDLALRVAVTVGGHHGQWPTASDLEVYAPPSRCGQDTWETLRRDLVRALQQLLTPPIPRPTYSSANEHNAFFTLLGGLTAAADWLGSNETYFPFADFEIDPEAYMARALAQARRALRETGWLGWKPPTEAITFESLCNVAERRPLQDKVVELAPHLDRPGLVIVEAPTGVGKTEAALYLADHWVRVLQQRGAYVAMPTMATSNQMFKRVREILARRYPGTILNYHLLHGNALLLDEDILPRLSKIGAKEEKQGTVAALSWFTKSKRGLLAPFAVGTVDQTLLSILQTPHFFVRLLGLSHKTVIFDEVHAYDTYMEELFFLLLRWLRAVNASVVILSATLPQVTRRKIIAAYTGIQESEIVFPANARYPSVTWSTGGQPQVILLPQRDKERREIILESVARDPSNIAERLVALLAKGGCAAVLCNTVERARQVFEMLYHNPEIRKLVANPEENLLLFHARFPLQWRMEVEGKIKSRFEKPAQGQPAGPRPTTIVVATQVIEQSLDLDFDVMVSDLAPVDLIIQRVGRLHRHNERDPHRPAPLRAPRLLLAMPEVETNGLPVFERGDAYIYSRYLLLRSYLALRGRPELVTPCDTEMLIESVYDPTRRLSGAETEPFASALHQAQQREAKRQRKAENEAQRKLIVTPDAVDFLEHPNAGLEEDNPDLHSYRRAATRLAPPSVTLICLHRTPDDRLSLDPEPGSPIVDVDCEPDWPTTRELVNRKVEVSNYDLVTYFVSRQAHKYWRDNAWLRHARLVVFKGGEGECEDAPFVLRLDRKLGLYMEDKL